MTEVFAFDDSHVERYADVLSSVARALGRSDSPEATAALEPIASEVWHGRLKLSGSVGPGGLFTGTRSLSDRLRAEVFAPVRLLRTTGGAAMHPGRPKRRVP